MQRPRIAVPLPTSFDEGYNARCWPQYEHAVSSCGGEIVAVPLNQSPARIAHLASRCEGILLPGSPADVNPQKYGQQREIQTSGPDLPRENVDELLLQDAHNLDKPILGICYGLQSLNVWRGGTLMQDLVPSDANHAAGPDVEVAHSLVLSPGSILEAVFRGDYPTDKRCLVARVNSSHHQAVLVPGNKLRVTAGSREDGVIEGLESVRMDEAAPQEPFVVGVQWHPERSFDFDTSSVALFHRFVAACGLWSPRTIVVSVAR